MAANDTPISAFSPTRPFLCPGWVAFERWSIHSDRNRAARLLGGGAFPGAFPDPRISRHSPQPSAGAERDAGALPAPHGPVVEAVLLEGRGRQGWRCTFGMDMGHLLYLGVAEYRASAAGTPVIVPFPLLLAAHYHR